MMKKIHQTIVVMALLTGTITANATNYYISPTGNNLYSGESKRKAKATLGAIQELVKPGDVVYILPGTYSVSEDEITREESSGPYKIVYDLSKNGTLGSPISYIGVADDDGNRPVFDFSAVQPEGYRVTGFLVSADYLILKNFEVMGMRVNRTDHTQSENIRVTNGSNNTFENIACHDGMGIGFYLTRESARNLFVNCDGYNNYDPISDINEKTGMGSGGNNDAFGCHVSEGCPNNIFIGCRAWNNADDGYDLINCYSAVTFCYSIAYKNGYDAENNSRGDGNGFKAGGYGMNASRTIPESGIPMHEVHHCIAAANKSNGIYSNHHLGGVFFHDNTSYRNGRYNYCMVNRKGPDIEDAIDVNGYGHKLERNLSMVSDGKSNHVTDLRGDEGDNIITDNSFYWVDKNSGGWAYHTYGNSIFESTKVVNLTIARDKDGMLTEETLAVMKQKSYQGLGCTFDDYKTAIEEAKRISGAEADNGATAINGVKHDIYTAASRIYNIQGQLVESTRKGLFIQNGKKFIVR